MMTGGSDESDNSKNILLSSVVKFVINDYTHMCNITTMTVTLYYVVYSSMQQL